MDNPVPSSPLLDKASFSTRAFARTTWRETWTFRRFVPTADTVRAAVFTRSPMPLIARVVRVRP